MGTEWRAKSDKEPHGVKRQPKIAKKDRQKRTGKIQETKEEEKRKGDKKEGTRRPKQVKNAEREMEGRDISDIAYRRTSQNDRTNGHTRTADNARNVPSTCQAHAPGGRETIHKSDREDIQTQNDQYTRATDR